MCALLADDVDDFRQLVDERLPLTEEPSEDGHAAVEFRGQTDWADLNHREEFTRRHRDIAFKVLSDASTSAPSIDQVEAFLLDSRDSCDAPFASALAELAGETNRLDQRLETIDLRSRNVPWYPRGFDSYDSDSAYRFLSGKKGEYRCTYSGAYCWGIEFVSRTGCDNLYVELTILDSTGRNIGFTNDTTSGVRAGERVVLIFDTFDSAADKARIAEVSCY
jgi:hypothetical protein